MKPILFVILALIGLNFALQSFDWLSFSNAACGFYRFNPTCSSPHSFLLNKIVRLFLHIFILFLIQRTYLQDLKTKFFFLYLTLILLAGTDISLLQGDDFLSLRMHGLVNPVVFSPLIAGVVLVIGVKGVFPPGPPSRGERP